MKFLLDTQAFLWFVLNDRALSQVARDLIVDPLNDILLSPATIGKLRSKLVLVSIKLREILKRGWSIKSKLTNWKYYRLKLLMQLRS
ncbi:MAG: hypothetical protein V7L23_33560 [Nostoc sp.]|uniref:hypothetical protein n=1 Tax=Nostoc sp. TaxID=1180 RepID=UPI002FF0D2A5